MLHGIIHARSGQASAKVAYASCISSAVCAVSAADRVGNDAPHWRHSSSLVAPPGVVVLAQFISKVALSPSANIGSVLMVV